ncbi:RelA/SpoT domain-containing protein [Delftia acidovorans]|jgi:ppGpp synthetase/RelA/SpoT-type nucleotidyltranferase|uniref:RelA/SpoT domain-containing protein n=1 Tax=Delftia acidovorans TaxID=80866 RepID=A0AAJ2R5R9_DELAC|nr:hypothetical protein [Delftia acidovorans]MDX4958086.1 hypothetical protein [Delftia acidovorans]
MNEREFRELFKSKTHTTEDQQKIAGDNWGLYRGIYEHYVSVQNDLENVGEAYSKLVQRIPGVHSVRWRCKDPIGLIDKIIRKKSDDDQAARKKYENISLDNYQELVTDLVGVRALYFFKDDFKGIHDLLMQKLRLKEKKPTYYHRKGDLVTSESNELKNWGLLPKEHPVGYRSIHYVAQGGIDISKSVIIEIQVRSLFDEAWSEIDHKIRYPVFDNNPLIENLLQILNKLVGGADELSNYIRHLSGRVGKYEADIVDANNEKNDLIQKIEKLERKAHASISAGKEMNASDVASSLMDLKIATERVSMREFERSILGLPDLRDQSKRLAEHIERLGLPALRKKTGL